MRWGSSPQPRSGGPAPGSDGPAASGPQRTDSAGNGVRTVFLAAGPYVPGSTRVFINGYLSRPGVDYTESDPELGEITFGAPPSAFAYVTIFYEGTI